MRLPNRSQLLAPLFAVLLITSAFAGGVGVDRGAATHDCSNLDSLVFFVSLTIANYDKCAMDHEAGSVTEVREATTNQTKSDIYSAALAQKAQTETTTTVVDNYLQDTDGAAWMKAESAVAQSYANGTAKSVAKSNARDAIGDYYAVKQKNLIDQWNTSATAFMALKQRARNESDISKNYVTFEATESVGINYIHASTVQNVTLTALNETTTLANGSTVGITTMEIFVEWNDDYQTTFHVNNAEGINKVSGTSLSERPVSFAVLAPDSNHDPLEWRDFSTMESRWTNIETQNSNLQDEVDTFVNNTWTAYDSGAINSSDVLSANTQMFEYGTDYGDNPTLYNSVAALANLGLETPDLNGTGTMTVMYQNYEYHGLVMAESAPNGSWSANTTYNASNISGPVFLVTTDGQKIDVSGEFRVASISSTDGSNVESVNATRVVYKTSNTTELQNKIEEIERLREQMEAKEQAAADGSGSGGSPIDSKYLLGALAVVGLLAYAQGNKGND